MHYWRSTFVHALFNGANYRIRANILFLIFLKIIFLNYYEFAIAEKINLKSEDYDIGYETSARSNTQIAVTNKNGILVEIEELTSNPTTSFQNSSTNYNNAREEDLDVSLNPALNNIEETSTQDHIDIASPEYEDSSTKTSENYSILRSDYNNELQDSKISTVESFVKETSVSDYTQNVNLDFEPAGVNYINDFNGNQKFVDDTTNIVQTTEAMTNVEENTTFPSFSIIPEHNNEVNEKENHSENNEESETNNEENNIHEDTILPTDAAITENQSYMINPTLEETTTKFDENLTNETSIKDNEEGKEDGKVSNAESKRSNLKDERITNITTNEQQVITTTSMSTNKIAREHHHYITNNHNEASNVDEDGATVVLLDGDWDEFNRNRNTEISLNEITQDISDSTTINIDTTPVSTTSTTASTTTMAHFPKRNGAARSTQRCPDGATPEYSVYGGTYCWTNSVCPHGSLCVQDQCCPSASNGAPSKRHTNSLDTSADLQITVYPHELNVREGKEASFECRARTTDQSAYPQVRWTRVGGRLPESAHEESGGRLTIHPTQYSDSGRYVCIASHNDRTVEAFAHLNIHSYNLCTYSDGPQEFQGGAIQQSDCKADERACASRQCIKADYFCDGEPDCPDRSDEANCPNKRHCEPNEFRCDNDRCIQKMWLCDGDDDCGDSSDERNCGVRKPGDVCQPTEFRCSDGQQCVPQSFQCDGTNDCRDGSDEIGCVQPTIVQAPDSNKIVPVGGDFKLTCRAVAVPDPYINWRLNWGPVCEPPRCQQQSEGGVGTLTVENAQPVDQGAYTCEAINVKGRVLATPDCIVRIVNIPAPPPPQPSPRPMTCHPQGAVAPQVDSRGQCQCKPNAAGPTCGQCSSGFFNLNDRVPQGCMRCFCFGVSKQCQSSHWFRTKEKLMFSGDSQGVVLATSDGTEHVGTNLDTERYGFLAHREPHSDVLYWKLPSQFLGNKVTSYGGQLSFQLEYIGSGSLKNEPLVILKGNGITLVHRARDHEGRFVSGQPFPLQIPTYEFSYEHLSGSPVSREDLMLVLAGVDTFLIRATHVDDQQSTSIGEVSWETAIAHDTQDVRALEVEECACPPGYSGTSCETCAPGYERSNQRGLYLGTCIPRRAPPAPMCSAAGAVSLQPSYATDRCQCKQNTVGPTCNNCAPGSFNLALQNSQGCSKCFCSGVTNQCQSSNLLRSITTLDYSLGAQDVLALSTQDARAPFTPSSQAQVYGDALHFNALSEGRGQSLYWKLPSQFLGDQITAYGGKLSFTHRVADSEESQSSSEPTVIIRGNDITLHHKAPVQPVGPNEQVVNVPITDEHWQRADGLPANREHLLMVLADLNDVLIKAGAANDGDSSAETTLIRVSLDRAVPAHEAPVGALRALEVEECTCPVGYVGTSCEDCAPGYSRTSGGLYLGLCQKCNCNGHATECDAEYGACIDCQHNTDGDQCERCRPGYVGDARGGTPNDCQRAPEREQARPPCQCYNHSPRGCDSFGRCLLCEHNTEGYHCETCKKGYYGDATRATPYDCTPCPCPGASDCFLDQSGQVQCRNCPAGFAGRLCDECAPGYTRSQTTGGRDCEPIGRVREETIQFVPVPEVALRVDILPPKHLSIAEGNRAKWTCKVSEQFKSEDVEVTWSKIGHASLPASTRQHGHQLIIDSANIADSGDYRCTGTHADQVATDDARLQVVPHQRKPPALPTAAQTQQPQAIVEPPYQQVDENQQAVFTCLTPGFQDCEVEWHFNTIGGALPPGAYKRGNQVFIPTVQQHHAGNYICTLYHTQGRVESNPGRLEVKRPQLRPMVDPPEHNVEVDDPARFRCWVPGVPNAVLKWRPAHGGADTPLPHGAEQHSSYLNFPRADHAHSGTYVCAAYDPRRDPHGAAPIDSEPVRLIVRQDVEIAQPPQVDPPYQKVELDDPVRFRCWVPGQPDAQLRWTSYDGRELPASAREEHNGEELHFPAVGESDAGAYICNVVDPSTGRNVPSAPARLDIQQKPKKPQADPPEQTVKAGDPSRIRCWVPGGSGNERLRWQWYGGGALPQGAHDDGRGTLTILRTGSQHQGAYECVAHDPYHPETKPQTSDPARIHLEHPATKSVVPSESDQTGNPPNPIATPPLLTVRRGEPAHFYCYAQSQSPAKIHWAVRDGAVQHGDALVIHAVDDAHVGEYICTATNPYGTRQAPPVRLELTDNDTPPTARVEPKIWNGKPGERHQFKCHVTGSPAPSISWRGPAEGGRLPADVVDLGDGVLEVSNARKEHDGDYTCTASNPIGEASDFGTVSVGPSLSVRTDPAGPKLVFTVGEAVKITCEAFGDPEPDVEWLHDPGPERGDLPDDFVPITITEQFIIHPNIGLGNAGRYTCKASNKFASVTKDIYIEVVEPSQLATVAVLGGLRQWFPPGQPAQLVCASSGASLVDRLEWTRSGGASGDVGAEQIEPGVLQFDPFKSSDEGVYECHAYRKEKRIASTNVTVSSDAQLSPDVINVEISAPTVRVVNKGDSIVLDCIVHGVFASRPGHQPIAYTWLHGRRLTAMRPMAWCAHPFLHMERMHSDHVGIYAAHVRFEDGVMRTSTAIFVVVRDIGHSPEEYTYEWSLARGGSIIRQLSKEAQLVIKDAEQSNDYGIYRCEVEDTNGDTVGEAQVAVVVGFDSASTPQEAKFDENSEAVLTCPVFVVPGATVTWTKMNDELPEKHEIRGHSLVIEQFDDTASGIYTCSVQYGQSSVEGFVDAKISVPDTTIKVVLNASAESVQVGERAWLDCIVVGDTNAKIEFSKEDSDMLPKNAQVTGNRLLFISISEENSGKYNCRAHTSEGPLETSALLNVESAKRKRKDLLESRHLTDKDLTIYGKSEKVSFSMSNFNAAPMPYHPKIHVAALTKHHHKSGHHNITHHNHDHLQGHRYGLHHKKHVEKHRRNQKSGTSRHPHHNRHHEEIEETKHAHNVHAGGERVISTLRPLTQRQRRLGEQQLRRRQRIAALRRQRQRQLQIAAEKMTRANAPTPVTDTIDQVVPLEHERALAGNHRQYKSRHSQYNHYDLKAADIDEKPIKSSIFGSWFTSS